MNYAFTKQIASGFKSCLRICWAMCMVLCAYSAQATITPTMTTTNGFVPNGTSELFVDVSFVATDGEFADAIGFRVIDPNLSYQLSGNMTASPPMGYSLSFGTTNSPSPYVGCGLDRGDQIESFGILFWAKPGYTGGQSGCGAFRAGETHTFPLVLSSSTGDTEPVTLELFVFSDGSDVPATSTVQLQPIACAVSCPGDIVAPVGDNGTAVVNVPSISASGCNMLIQNYSGTYPLGTTPIVVRANSNPDVSCTFNIIVEDSENPVILNCANIVENLEGGECGRVVDPGLSVQDNGVAIPTRISQNNSLASIDSGVTCPGGLTKVYRVFDTEDYDIDTELEISEIRFGVLESSDFPEVTATIYTVDGGFPGGNLVALASSTSFGNNGSEFIHSISINATIPAGSQFVVELSTAGTQFGGLIFGTNFDGETSPSYIETDFCGQSLGTYADAGYPGHALVMEVVGQEAATSLVQTAGNYSPGDEFPIGTHTLSFVASDASGNTSGCSMSVTVEAFDSPITSISCNDEVQISLGDDCTAVVTPDQVLEGNLYSCYDDYTVEITDEYGNKYGDMITESNIGQTLTVTVYNQAGNSCWGKIVIEDKGPAPLDCQDVYTTCTGSTDPGSPVSTMVTFAAEIEDPIITDDEERSYTFDIPVFGLVGSTVTDVNMVLDIDHTHVGDITATLSAPDGTSVALISAGDANCEGENMKVTFDDEAMYTYDDYTSACEASIPAIQGAYQADGLLSTFDGIDPNGTWKITISDMYEGDGGEINKLNLVISQTGATVSFPTTNPVSFFRTGPNQFEVEGIDPCGSVTAVYADNEVDQPCTSQYSKIISRSWFVEDEQGNTSTPCIQNIYVFRNDLSTLEFPPNYDGLQLPALSCTQWGETVPDSTITGVPSGDFCDNVQIFPYEDQRIDICPKSYKIIRKWRLLEWCSGDVIEHNQIIKVADDQGPRLSCPADETISAEVFDCYANYVATKPTVLSECSDNVTYELSYVPPGFDGLPDPAGIYVSTNVTQSFGGQTVITELPMGTSSIKWTVYDECGNYGECTYNVTIEDQVPPVAVCDEFTVASVGSDGLVYVNAYTFDDGSLDNCQIEKYEARKMVDACGISGTSLFREEIAFCCAEIGSAVMVEFRVTDVSGNANTCMVEVTVQDKLPPYITECPADITLDCQADYKDLSVTGEPVAIDNCGQPKVEMRDSGDIDNCGRGTIRRTWTATDAQGLKHSCVQRITLADRDPFSEKDIDWPDNYDATTCYSNLDPENLPERYAYPRFNDDICSLTATDYEDQVFTFVDGSCEKILRKWTVIDWCTYNPSQGGTSGYTPGLYHFTQIVKLSNTIAPEIQGGCAPIEACSFGDCGGSVTLTKEATDDCTAATDLNWTWTIDRYADGVADLGLSGRSNSATVNLPNGWHEITWVVEDKCGNTDICRQRFRVKDCKKPTPYCRSTVTTVVMPSSGSIAIWANDFNIDSYDNCTEKEDLKFSFSPNVNVTSRTFTCSDIPDGESMYIPLDMYVTDEEGNQDFCEVALILQDGIGNVCDSMALNFVNGNVELTDGTPLPKSNIILETLDIGEVQKQESDLDGKYAFSTLVGGRDYKLTVNKTDAADLGVSTLDLVLIQRHILTIKTFDDPYQIVAADVDNNDRVSGADVVALRKLILGRETVLPNGQEAWRFLPKNGGMDVNTVFPYKEEILLNDVDRNYSNQDFVGVKIGDVNNTYVNNFTGNASEIRSAKALTLTIDQDQVSKGETVEIPVYASQLNSILGYQFTLNHTGLKYVGVEAGSIAVGEENIAAFDNHVLTTSWNNVAAVEVASDEALFTLTFEAERDITLAEALAVSSEKTRAEAYDGAENVHQVILTKRSEGLDLFTVAQNIPNPFTDQTSIQFYTPADDVVSLEIRDLNGRLLMMQSKAYTAGEHSIVVDNEQLGANGVLVYTLSNATESVTRRMIAIK